MRRQQLGGCPRCLPLVRGSRVEYRRVMSRPLLATIAGLVFIAVYIAAVVAIPELLGRLHWVLEAVFWGVAGIVWVFPIRWLMLWSVGKR